MEETGVCCAIKKEKKKIKKQKTRLNVFRIVPQRVTQPIIH